MLCKRSAYRKVLYCIAYRYPKLGIHTHLIMKGYLFDGALDEILQPNIMCITKTCLFPQTNTRILPIRQTETMCSFITLLLQNDTVSIENAPILLKVHAMLYTHTAQLVVLFHFIPAASTQVGIMAYVHT